MYVLLCRSRYSSRVKGLKLVFIETYLFIENKYLFQVSQIGRSSNVGEKKNVSTFELICWIVELT